MLVLTRKEKETILIGNDVEIVVIECGNGRVRLAIKAPGDVLILRGELIVESELEAIPA